VGFYCEVTIIAESTIVTNIIGIVLVKNEDLFIERVLKNSIEFCDEIIVADNLSTDETRSKVKRLQAQYPSIRYQAIESPSQSHDLITAYAGTKTWIFAVDGDELYDPAGLALLRGKIVAGEYDKHWMLLGNALNCLDLNIERGYARGYLAPPCRSMTKLYNFSMIESWDGPCPERLHGGEVIFKKGYDNSLRFEMYKDISWEDAYFRCLHLCFIRRSSLEKVVAGDEGNRKNISDLLGEGILARVKSRCLQFIGIKQHSSWKKDKYMRGQLVEKSVVPFVC